MLCGSYRVSQNSVYAPMLHLIWTRVQHSRCDTERGLFHEWIICQKFLACLVVKKLFYIRREGEGYSCVKIVRVTRFPAYRGTGLPKERRVCVLCKINECVHLVQKMCGTYWLQPNYIHNDVNSTNHRSLKVWKAATMCRINDEYRTCSRNVHKPLHRLEWSQ